jgi:hypothetical protein
MAARAPHRTPPATTVSAAERPVRDALIGDDLVPGGEGRAAAAPIVIDPGTG